MIGPQLHRAIVPALNSLVASRVFDRVTPNAARPYIVVGQEQTNDEGDQCHDHFEVFLDVHVYSEVRGSLEAKEIAENVRKRLTLNGDLIVDQYFVIEQKFETGRVLTDPDGKTAHAILTFRFLLQPNPA